MRRLSGAVQRLQICWEPQREREREKNGQTTRAVLLLLYQITVVPSSVSPPLSLVLSICCFLPVCVGLIEAFRHRIKASGSVPQRSQLEAVCPNAKEKLKQSSSKQPSSKRGGVLGLQHRRVYVF